MPVKGPRHSGAAATGAEALTYAIRDIVLAKVKGHPAWPARIIDPNTAPPFLRDERKIGQKNSYLVKFFQTGDHAWMNTKEMSKLERSEIQAFVDNPNKKGADLRAAYEIALAPEEWEAQVEANEQKYQESLKALELDELDGIENDESPALPTKVKPKRKRPSEAKAPQETTKKRKSEVLHPNNSSNNASATPEPAGVSAPKKRGRKKEEVAPVIEGVDIVREWRHKLQRLFLGKTEVTAKMMPEIDQTFRDIEAFEMKTEWLTSSKLGKVLKRIGALEDEKVPLDEEYNIRSRSRQLQEKWRLSLGIGEDSHRVQTAVEGSNDPADIPNRTDEVVTNGGADTKPVDDEAPALPPAKEDETMAIDESKGDAPTNASVEVVEANAESVPANHWSEKVEQNGKPAPTTTAVDSDADMQDPIPIEAATKEDADMKEAPAKSEVAADDDDDDKMDCGASTPPEDEPIVELAVQVDEKESAEATTLE